jgi:hypothetical protein
MSVNVNDIILSLRYFIVNWLDRWSFALTTAPSRRPYDFDTFDTGRTKPSH